MCCHAGYRQALRQRGSDRADRNLRSPLRRLVTYTAPSGTNASTIWSYDLRGNVRFKLTRGGQQIENTYDTLDRMVTLIVPQPLPTPSIQTAYTYDLAGRTLSVSDTTGQGLTYTFDSAKRVIAAGQTAPNFSGVRWFDGNLRVRPRKLWTNSRSGRQI